MPSTTSVAGKKAETITIPATRNEKTTIKVKSKILTSTKKATNR